ncbi:MAG: hypothetical protein ACRD1O_08650, partial [Terriglobia bacterium]
LLLIDSKAFSRIARLFTPGGRLARQTCAFSLFPVKQGLQKMRAMVSAHLESEFIQLNNSRRDEGDP